MSIIGLDLGATKMRVGVVSGQKIVKSIRQGTKSQGTQKEVIKQITDLLDSLVTRKIKAIGVGVPGLVDFKTGTVLEVVNIPSWQRVPLKKTLEKKYKRPVYVDNDANCLALGEKYFGKGRQYNNFAAVTLGTGLGTGLIINGGLYRGKNGGAGEFGQIVYKEGVLENYASGQFFLRKYKIESEKLWVRAKKGDKKAIKIFKEYGEHLGKALSMLVYALDPEIIILGGAVAGAYNFFRKAMRESLKESSYKRVFKRVKIEVSLEQEMGILGAAFLANGTN